MVNFNFSNVGKYATDLPSLYKKGCDTDILKDDVHRCESGLLHAREKIVLLGDSIGVQWFPAIDNIYGKQHAIVSYTKSACTVVDKPIYYSKIGRIYDECERWRNKVINNIIQESPSIIFMGSSVVNLSHDDWVSGLVSTIDKLNKTHAQIYILRPTPILSIHPMQCLKREIWASQFVDVGELCNSIKEMDEAKNNQIYAFLLEVKARYKNVHVLDMNDLICNQGSCQLKKGEIVSYRDAQHLTASFVATLSSKMSERINQP